jgi:hypothetical protein
MVMIEHPIPMNGAMVRATLRDENPKSQTRRIVKLPHNNPLGQWEPTTIGGPNGGRTKDGLTIPAQGEIWHTRTGDSRMCPHGQPGDRLWVRETFVAFGRWETRYSEKKGRDEWHFVDMTLETGRQYRYDGAVPNAKRASVTPTWWKRPSIFMPRVASRIKLEVTDVRVERLNDISASDARAEGIEYRDSYIAGQRCRAWRAYGSANGWYPEGVDTAPRHSFQSLWDSLAPPGADWQANPWVWVVEFKRIAP